MKRIILFAVALLAAASAFAQSFDITLASGAKMRVEACKDDIFRVQITEEKDFPESIMLRYGIFRSGWESVGATIDDGADKAVIKTAKYALTVDKGTGKASLADAEGNVIIESIEYLTAKDPLLAELADKYNAQFRYLNEHVNIIGSDHWEQNVDAGVDITDKSRTSALRFSLKEQDQVSRPQPRPHPQPGGPLPRRQSQGPADGRFHRKPIALRISVL